MKKRDRRQGEEGEKANNELDAEEKEHEQAPDLPWGLDAKKLAQVRHPVLISSTRIPGWLCHRVVCSRWPAPAFRLCSCLSLSMFGSSVTELEDDNHARQD